MLTRILLIACVCSVLPASASRGGVELSAEEQQEGFVHLFDGATLTGWTGAVDGYDVEEEALSCIPDKGGNLYTSGEYADFILRFDCRLDAGGNNGIGIRVPDGGHASTDGMEIQMLDSTAERYKDIKPYQFHGSVYGIIPAKRGYLKPVGAWNQHEIRCIGRHITIVLNGETIVDGDLDAAMVNGAADGKEHAGAKRSTGHIVLCGHGTRVQFRNMRIRTVPSPEPVAGGTGGNGGN
jgi:hypothetical protein